MANGLFPRKLSRTQFLLRFLAWFAVVALGFFLFVAAQISGEVYYAWIILCWAYGIFGLAVPRLRNAKLTPWLAGVLLVPLANLVMLVVLFVVPEKTPAVQTSPAPPLPLEPR